MWSPYLGLTPQKTFLEDSGNHKEPRSKSKEKEERGIMSKKLSEADEEINTHTEKMMIHNRNSGQLQQHLKSKIEREY